MDTERRSATGPPIKPSSIRMELDAARSEILVFWRLPDGTRCSVVRGPTDNWRLLVLREGREVLTEDFADPRELLYRAEQLRPVFQRSVA